VARHQEFQSSVAENDLVGEDVYPRQPKRISALLFDYLLPYSFGAAIIVLETRLPSYLLLDDLL